MTPEDVKKAILAADDFGHEMRVGGVLTNVKYPAIPLENPHIHSPAHGGTYTDLITSKPRQFDYRCRIERQHSRNIFLALECKNLHPSSPLVICGRARTRDEAYHAFITFGTDGNLQVAKVEGNSSIYRPGEFVGKSLLRVKSRDMGKDKNKSTEFSAETDPDVYDRWSQALASSFDLAWNVRKFPSWRSFVMPLVVVPDDSLWTLSYNGDGSISKDPERVNECHFFVERKLPIAVEFVLTHIHFLTLSGLSQMLESFVQRDGRIWDSIFSVAATAYKP